MIPNPAKWMIIAAVLAFPAAVDAKDTNEVSRVRLSKVLVNFIDKKGMDRQHPSLNDRDRYQFELRTHAEKRAGVRFHVLWGYPWFTPGRIKSTPTVLRVEVKGLKDSTPTSMTFEKQSVKPGWSDFDINAESCKELGQMVSWQVSVLQKDRVLATKRSFLWGGGSSKGVLKLNSDRVKVNEIK